MEALLGATSKKQHHSHDSLSSSPTGQPTAVNSYSWKALMGSAVGYAMDGFDLLILGFMLSAISADLNLTTGQAGSLVNRTD